MTVAAQKAARVWPLGKLRRLRLTDRHPALGQPDLAPIGARPADDRLERRVDQARLDAGDGQRPDGPGPLGPGVPGPPHRGGRPHQTVVAQSGDHLGRAVEGRIPPPRLEPARRPAASTRSTRAMPAGRPRRPIRRVVPHRRRTAASMPSPAGSAATVGVGHADPGRRARPRRRPPRHLPRPRRRQRRRRPSTTAACSGIAAVGRAEVPESAVVAQRRGVGAGSPRSRTPARWPTRRPRPSAAGRGAPAPRARR